MFNLRFPVNGVLTWIWGASCVPRVAFHAAPPGRGQGWGWWWDNGRSPCRRSSTRSPGTGDVPAGFCGTHKHAFHFSMAPKIMGTMRHDTNNTQLYLLMIPHYRRVAEGSTDRILLPYLQHMNWDCYLKTCINGFITKALQFLIHYTVLQRHYDTELWSPDCGPRTVLNVRVGWGETVQIQNDMQ